MQSYNKEESATVKRDIFQKITENKKVIVLILLGALSLFLGTANPIIHIPLLVMGFPAAVFLLAREASSTKQAFLYGWLTGTLGVSLGMYWLVVPVNVFGGFPLLLSLPVPIAMGAANGVYTAVIASVLHKGRGKSELWQVLFMFLTWYFFEWLRAWFVSGFTWMAIAPALAAFPMLVQGASLIGLEGLSALYASLGAGLVTKKRSVQAFSLLGVLALIGFGFVRMQGDIEKDNVATGTYLLVQGNISQELKWNPQMQATTLDKYLKLSIDAVNARVHDEIDVVVYPETALPFYLQNENEFHAKLKQFTQKHQIPIISGGATYRRGLGKLQLFNSAFLIKPEQKSEAISLALGQVYSKQHLVPFGEYIPPFLDLKAFEFLFAGLGAFTPGKYQVPLEYNGHSLGILICYEAIFSYLAQESVEKGAQVLVNISNDAWYGYSAAAKQHLDLSLLRAIEQNRYMVRSTNTGITAFISPYGEILSQTSLFEDATLVGNIGYRDVKTIYHYLFPYLPYVFNLLFIVFVCMLLRSSIDLKYRIKRRKK